MYRQPESASPRRRLPSAPLIRAAALLVSTAALFACSNPEGPNTPQPARLQLDPATATAVSLGETIQFTARVLDQDGTALQQVPLTWASSDTTILVSEGNGRFRARANGAAFATVELTNDNRLSRLTAEVVVHQLAARITFASDTLKFYAIGQTTVIQARVLDALGNDLVGTAAPTWSSAGPDIATVDPSGTVTATGDGEILISVQAGDVSKSFVAVVAAAIRITGCVSSADLVGTVACNGVLLTVHH